MVRVSYFLYSLRGREKIGGRGFSVPRPRMLFSNFKHVRLQDELRDAFMYMITSAHPLFIIVFGEFFSKFKLPVKNLDSKQAVLK